MTHIMVVDPNEAFATLLSEELKHQGYDVAMCLTAADALASAEKRMPDMALVDMALDDPDAISLAQQLREVDGNVRLMLIPLMGEQLAPEEAAISVQGILPKPFFLPELPERIEAALQIPLDEGLEANVDESGEATGVPEPESAEEDELVFMEEADVQAEVQAEAEVQPEAKIASEPEPAREADEVSISAADMEEGGLSYDAFTRNRTRVESAMSTLAQEAGADAVLLTFGGGLLTWVGGLERGEVESISRAVVHGWRTSAEVARILGREQERFEQSITGGDYMLYALSVEVNAIMAVVVRGAAPLGLLRHRARSTVEKIARLCVR